MKDKMAWAQKKQWPTKDPEFQDNTNKEIERLSFEWDDFGVLPIEDINKILTLMETYLSQYGLLQICIDIGFAGRYVDEGRTDDSYALLDLNYETECQMVGAGWNVALRSATIARLDQHQDKDYVEKAQKAGRDIYYALKEKHPLLTRDLFVPGYTSHNKVYEIVCQKCGVVLTRKRKCELVEHPEHFRCHCGGKLALRD